MRVVLFLFFPAALVAADPAPISGVVRDANGPVAGATVRVQRTAVSARTGERGEFTLKGFAATPQLNLTGYAPGYYIAGPVVARPGDTNVSITLKKHTTEDNTGYEWLSANISSGQDSACQNCHSDAAAKTPVLPFDEWSRDAHGTSAVNRRFLSMYNGTDLTGELRSPLTRFGFHKDYGRFPLPPDSSQPYYGPGFKLDFTDSAGNCAACHLPAASVRAPYDTDPNTVTGVGKEGVACDLCHKVWSAKLDPLTGKPYPNTPGVLSLDLRRPDKGHQLFLGPYDDVAPGEDSLLPLQNQSQMCAACHFGQFWGIQVYNSFGEWLDSPYSDPVKGQTCQDCHMPRRGSKLVARVDKGAGERDPKTVFSHLMPGAADVALLQDTASLRLEAWREGASIRVMAVVKNEKAGHHIPTDHPARNILLVVSASGAAGDQLPLVWGSTVPDWGGQGDDADDYGGRPGAGYAKVLEELWTEISPTAAYWNPCVIREDTRIPAFGSDITNYGFQAPAGEGPVTVTAKLIFRRAFKTLQRQKQWDMPDILMNQAKVVLP